MPLIQFQFRRGTAAEWTSANPILADGEMGIEKDTGQFKLGNGVATWSARPYGGIVGPQGIQGNTGNTGNTGAQGDKGWSPILAVVTDGTRRVFQIVDWVGGAGTKPSTTNQFIGAAGIVSTAAAAVDVRGAQGLPGTNVVADETSLTLSGSTLSAKVDGILNTHLAPMLTMTFKGNNTGGTAGPQDLTAAQATAMLNTATSALKGLMSDADKRKLDQQAMNVTTDFGANNLDKTGATDSTARMTAIIAAVAAGSVLYFPPGAYVFNSTVTVNKFLIFEGGGEANTLLYYNNATTDHFLLTAAAAGSGFRSLRFICDPPLSRTAGFAVNLADAANAWVRDCDILFHHSGIRSAGGLQYAVNCNIREMGADAAGGSCILVEGTGDRYFSRITTDNPNDPTGFGAIRIRRCASTVITDSNIINGNNALDIVANGGAGTAVASILSANTFYDSSQIGVNIVPASNSDTIHRVRFVNCWFGSNAVAGVMLGNGSVPNANINAVDFIGCDFFGAGAAGAVSAQGVHLDVRGCSEWSVRASRLCGANVRAIDVAPGVGTADHNFAITDNLIGAGMGTGTPNAHGLRIQAGTYGRYQVIDNRGLDTNTLPGIIDLGTIAPTGQKNVVNNMGTLAGSLPALVSGGGSLHAAGGRGAVTSGTAETFLATFRVPTNAVQVGDILWVTGIAQSSSTGALTLRVRAGTAGTVADALINVSAVSAAGTANSFVVFNAYIYIIALGATGTVAAAIQGTSTAAAFNNAAAAEVAGNVNTAAPWFVTLSGATALGTYTIRQLKMRPMG